MGEAHVDLPSEESVPVIDLLPLITTSDHSCDPTAKQSLIDQMRYACKNYGMFQVINHGVPPEKFENLESVARKFYSRPREEKMKVVRDIKNPYGYTDSMHTRDSKDSKEVFDFATENQVVLPVSPDDATLHVLTNQWPQNPPEFREVCEEYVHETHLLAYKLLGLISLSLGLPEDRLHGFVKGGTGFTRLSYYPPCPDLDAPGFGIGAHTDPGVLTILVQDAVGGLETKRLSDGKWIPVKPIPNAIIVNIGDMLQVFSNDIYESNEHRVLLNHKRDRFAVPLAINPGHDFIVQPLEELINEQNPPKYKPYNWGKFRVTRHRTNYEKLNRENLQFYHFRISE